MSALPGVIDVRDDAGSVRVGDVLLAMILILILALPLAVVRLLMKKQLLTMVVVL